MGILGVCSNYDEQIQYVGSEYRDRDVKASRKKKMRGTCPRIERKGREPRAQLPPLIRKPLVEGPVEAEVPAILDR